MFNAITGTQLAGRNYVASGPTGIRNLEGIVNLKTLRSAREPIGYTAASGALCGNVGELPAGGFERVAEQAVELSVVPVPIAYSNDYLMGVVSGRDEG
ncbi:hypothetical protein BOTCAL_0029g00480 [Botryotinia calthae]|uniref:Uncharacterized protein n=1 Tax=Botryotinia calthae TaxID=38488 RepID=A0A4Y8DDT7_9HELO|nr:hypothetical protein BOTCAL_0029g00480 [Botryotinia calthae]